MFYIVLQKADSRNAIFQGQYGDNKEAALSHIKAYSGGIEPRKLDIPNDYCHWIDDVIGAEQYIAGQWAVIGYTVGS